MTTPEPTQSQIPPPQRKPFSRRMIILLAVVGVLVLLGISGLVWFLRSASDPNQPLSGASNSTIVRLHAWRCERSDGTQYFSGSGVYRCGWEPTSDAGKSCTSSSQCEAGCICDSDVATEDCFQCAPYRRGSGVVRYEDRYPTVNGNTNRTIRPSFSCQTTSDCTLSTIGTDPQLAQVASQGLRNDLKTEVNVACTSKTYFNNNKDQFGLRADSIQPPLESACICSGASTCAIQPYGVPAQPSPVSTAGWKTYMHAGERFSFQYPPDYWVEKFGTEGDGTFWVNLTSPQTVSIKAGTGGAQSDAISFQPHMTATDLAEIFGSPSPLQYTLSFFQSLGLLTNVRTVILGGRAGFQVDVSELNTIRYTFTKNAAGDYFVISQIQVDANNGEVNATQYYETILSTFTFTE